MLPISSGVCAILRLKPDDEIERSLALHDLRRRVATDRRLDEPVDRVGAQPYRAILRGRQ